MLTYPIFLFGKLVISTKLSISHEREMRQGANITIPLDDSVHWWYHNGMKKIITYEK